MIDPDGGLTTYSYDSRNLLAALENSYNERTTWQYDALGRATTMSYANGAIAEYDYDAAGRLTALRNLKADRSALSIFTYSYDAVGNRTQVQEASGDVVSWSYDEIGQLTRERRSGANSYDMTYTYDAVGNRLTKEEGGVVTTYSYDAANQLLTTEDNTGVTSFSYDANGNTLLELWPNSDRVTYTWDIENRQTKVELPANVVNTITLDGDGKRRSIEDTAGLRKLIWEGENILAELDNADATLAAYTLAPEIYGSLISQHRSGATSFHHFDGLGSTNKLTDSNAASLVEYLYRAFGQQSVLSGSSANRFTWVGKLGYYRQADPDDYWVRARIASPISGRWLSRDLLQDYRNAYSYAGNRPIDLNDPTGMFCMKTGSECHIEWKGKPRIGPLQRTVNVDGPFVPKWVWSEDGWSFPVCYYTYQIIYFKLVYGIAEEVCTKYYICCSCNPLRCQRRKVVERHHLISPISIIIHVDTGWCGGLGKKNWGTGYGEYWSCLSTCQGRIYDSPVFPPQA